MCTCQPTVACRLHQRNPPQVQAPSQSMAACESDAADTISSSDYTDVDVFASDRSVKCPWHPHGTGGLGGWWAAWRTP